jgi:hypothetical protein
MLMCEKGRLRGLATASGEWRLRGAEAAPAESGDMAEAPNRVWDGRDGRDARDEGGRIKLNQSK